MAKPIQAHRTTEQVRTQRPAARPPADDKPTGCQPNACYLDDDTSAGQCVDWLEGNGYGDHYVSTETVPGYGDGFKPGRAEFTYYCARPTLSRRGE